MGVQHGWNVIGQVDIREPGSYEILYKNGGVGVGIRRVGAPSDQPLLVDANEVAHPCRPCSCCNGCACGEGHNGQSLCGHCSQHTAWAEETRPLLDVYLAAVGRKDAFVETNGRTHAVGCSSLKSNINAAAAALEAGCTHRTEWFVRVPVIVGADAPRRKRCAVCCPDVIVPAAVGSVRGPKGRFVAHDAPPTV